jgi:MscS family membrane protein
LHDLIHNHPLWLFLVGVLIGLLVLDRIVHGLLRILSHRARPEQQVWWHAGVAALNAPLRALIWILGAAVIVRHAVPRGDVDWLDDAWHPAVGILVTLVVGWALFRYVDHAARNLRARAAARDQIIDSTALDAVGKLLRAVIVVAAALSIMQNLNVSLAGLLAFGGAAGIAVGFAAQTLVANLFGGLTIFASRIFKIGEAIIIPGTDLMGDVQHIGWRSTLVMGWDCKPFYVPNSMFNTSAVINHSRMTFRRASETIYLRYEDIAHVPAIVRAGNALLEASDDVDYFVFRFASYGQHALQLYLYAYIRATAYADYMRIKERLLLQIGDIVRREGCTLVMPLAHLRLEDAPDALRSAEQVATARR